MVNIKTEFNEEQPTEQPAESKATYSAPAADIHPFHPAAREAPIPNPKRNEYFEELQKFIGQRVRVVTATGEEFTGICKAVLYQHLNVVLMTGSEKILIKNISHMVRARTSAPHHR